MTKVLKRKGTVEPYKPDKIKGSLQKATIDAGYSVNKKEDIIKGVLDNINKKLDKGGEIKSDAIRACLLTELDECEPYIAKSWRNFDKRYKSP